MTPLGKLIETRRRSLGLTWAELAKCGGFSAHTIPYSYKSKPYLMQLPRAITMQRLAKALEIPYDELQQAAIASLKNRLPAARIPSQQSGLDARNDDHGRLDDVVVDPAVMQRCAELTALLLGMTDGDQRRLVSIARTLRDNGGAR